MLQLCVGAKGVSRHDLTLSVESQKLLGQLRNGLGSLRSGAFPIGAAHFGKAGNRTLAAHIFMQKAYLIHRHIQLIISRIS